MATLVHIPVEGNSLIAKGPDGTLVNLRATSDGTLLITDPTNSPNYNAAYSYTYDNQGRMVTVTRVVDGIATNYNYAYDPTTGNLDSQSTDLYPAIDSVLSVAGRVGAITLSSADVQLGAVDNARQEYYVPGGQEGEYLDGGGALGSRQWKRLQSDLIPEGINNLYFTNARKAELMALMGASAPVAVWYTNYFNNVSTPSTNGSRASFTLDHVPGSAGHVDISKNGLTQVLNVDYMIAGAVVTFTSAPLTTDSIFIRYGASLPVGTSAANSVVVADTGNYYSGTDQEAVNAQIGRFINRVISAFAGLGVTVVNS
jgi:hypothetical protein